MSKDSKVVLTGDRPTGRLHLGHFVGSIRNRIELQDQYAGSFFYMIADVQALTDNADDPGKIRKSVLDVALDNLACGMDPKKTTMFIQSQIPEIAELSQYFSNLVTLARLQRNPTLKSEMQAKGYEADVPTGFLMYPISQAADILFCKGNIVPVGEDQKPMIEQANEIVEKFNRLYGNVFTHILAEVPKDARLVGLDGEAKMSKSLNNALYLSDSAEEVERKIMGAYTDPGHVHVNDPGKVEGNVVFSYLDAFDTDTAAVQDIKDRYEAGGLGDVEVKKRLIAVLNNLLEPIRVKRAELESNTDDVMNILEEGTKSARAVAQSTLQEVKSAMGINYFN